MPDKTRIIAMGSALLMEGFALVGVETWPDAEPTDVRSLIDELLRERKPAVILLASELMREAGAAQAGVGSGSEHIIVAEIPSLQAAQGDRPAVERLIREMLGPGALTRNAS